MILTCNVRTFAAAEWNDANWVLSMQASKRIIGNILLFIFCLLFVINID